VPKTQLEIPIPSDEDATAWLDDMKRLGSEGRYFIGLNRYLIVADKPGAWRSTPQEISKSGALRATTAATTIDVDLSKMRLNQSISDV
jgi:hypothetical protein